MIIFEWHVHAAHPFLVSALSADVKAVALNYRATSCAMTVFFSPVTCGGENMRNGWHTTPSDKTESGHGKCDLKLLF